MRETLTISTQAPDFHAGADFAEAFSDLKDRYASEWDVEVVDMAFSHGGELDPVTITVSVDGERENVLGFLRMVAPPHSDPGGAR